MTKIKSVCDFRAVKDLDTDTVLVYRAYSCKDHEYEICVERYKENILLKSSSVTVYFEDVKDLDDLLLKMCLGSLEPCHLKDVIADLCD